MTCWAVAVEMGWRRCLEVWTDVLYEKYRSWDRCSKTLVFLVTVITLGSEPSVRGGKFRSQLNLKCLYQFWGSLSGCFASRELLWGSLERRKIVREWSFPLISPGVQVVLFFNGEVNSLPSPPQKSYVSHSKPVDTAGFELSQTIRELSPGI